MSNLMFEHIKQIAQLHIFNEIIKDFNIPMDGKKNGNVHFSRCPLHEDKTPSFFINYETNSFFCYSCNAGSTNYALVKALLEQRNAPNKVHYNDVVRHMEKYHMSIRGRQITSIPEPRQGSRKGFVRERVNTSLQEVDLFLHISALMTGQDVEVVANSYRIINAINKGEVEEEILTMEDLL